MKDTNNQAERPSATPFFARFLEDQHGRDAAAANQTLKYPSDRDEWDFNSHVLTEAATNNAGPSNMTLKYPSDRDEDPVYYS